MADLVSDRALLNLLSLAERSSYTFVPTTPLTHARVTQRHLRQQSDARTLTDILGWNLPFDEHVADPELIALLHAAQVLKTQGIHCKSLVRIASLRDALYLHSGFPTDEEDAVFFGPDTYRFLRYVFAHLPPPTGEPLRCLDAGCGSGAGGIAVGRERPDTQWTFSDINREALRFTRLNALHNGVSAEVLERDGLQDVDGPYDCIIINPPYLVDERHRSYRDGGGSHGEALSVRLVSESLKRLAPQGRLLLYTGVPIISGTDPLKARLAPLLNAGPYRWRYEELDPDVFGEELEKPAYADADRIAVVGARVERA